MPPFDLALAIEIIYLAAQYEGTTYLNTKAQYDSLIWTDPRPQPTWEELQDAWANGWQAYYPDWVDPTALPGTER